MTYAENKKIFHDYKILETYEAGISLKGHEVKAIKKGMSSIKGAYVKIMNEEAFLIGAVIPPYQPENTPKDYDPQRTRKLLLKKEEIEGLIGKKKGLTLMPIKLYNKKGKVKLEIGLAQKLKKYDKRELIKKKEEKRKIERILRNR